MAGAASWLFIKQRIVSRPRIYLGIKEIKCEGKLEKSRIGFFYDNKITRFVPFIETERKGGAADDGLIRIEGLKILFRDAFS